MEKKLYFFLQNKTGGAENITLKYSNLLSMKFRTKLVFVGQDDSESSTRRREGSIFLKVRKFKFSALRLFKFLKNEKPDFIFTSIHGLAIPLLLSNLFLKGSKIIIRQSFMPNRYSRNSITTIVVRTLYPRAHKIVAQTDEMKRMMIDYYNLDSVKIKVLNNPIDNITIQEKIKDGNPFQNINGFKFITVGNVRPVKGQDILIKAFEKLLKKMPDSYLFVVGRFSKEDPYFLKMQEWIESHKLQERIIFTGYSDNPYKYIYNSDCFILPSRSEGLPNALLEAMYLNKPVVATKCISFIEQVIRNDYNGFTVEVDDFQQMAESMHKAVQMNYRAVNFYKPCDIDDLLELFN